MLHLKLPHRSITANLSEIKKLAIDFYCNLFQSRNFNSDCEAEILKGLPWLDEAMATSLDSKISNVELWHAATQLWLVSWCWQTALWVLQEVLGFDWTSLVCCTETMSDPEDSTSLLYKSSPHIASKERRSRFAEEVTIKYLLNVSQMDLRSAWTYSL